jgi:uncharacterized protein YaiE (UPF0345 family)
MPRQFLSPALVLHDTLGTEPAAGGSIQFYEVGTTTPKDTWDDFAQGDPNLNANPVPLDSAGRLSVPVWGDGNYSFVLRNAEGETIADGEWRPEQAGSDELPAKEAGKVLGTDGESWIMVEVREVPDPTGFSGRVLTTDGENLLWSTAASILAGLIPEAPTLDIVVGTSSLRIGDGTSSTKYLLQFGSDTAPPGGGLNTTSKATTFPTAFDSILIVIPVPTVTEAGAGGFLPTPSVVAQSPTGFSVKFDTNGGDEGNSAITNSITYNYLAVGKVTVDE